MAPFFVLFVLSIQILSALDVAATNNNTIITCDKYVNDTCTIDCSIQNCDYAVIDRKYFQDIDMIIDCQTSTCTSIHIKWPDFFRTPKNLELLCGQINGTTASCSRAIVEVARADVLKIECYGFGSCGYLKFILNGRGINHLHLRFFQTSPPSQWTNIIFNEDERPLTVMSRNDEVGFHYIGLLTLECAEQGCTQSVIDLRRVIIERASVICDHYESCVAVEWTFPVRTHMDIYLGSKLSVCSHCSHESIISVNLLNEYDGSQSGSLYVDCQNCDNLNLEVFSSLNVWEVPSEKTFFNNVTIECWSCREEDWRYESSFVFWRVDATFVCLEDACFRTEIDAKDANSLQLVCDGDSSCFENEVTCPAYRRGACNIECSDNDQSCHRSKVYVDNDYTAGYLDWYCSFNASLEGQNQCLIEFNCLDYTDDTDEATKLPTNLTWNATSSAYGCEHGSSEYCCPNGVQKLDEEHNARSNVEILAACAILGALAFGAFLRYATSKKKGSGQTNTSS